MDSSVDVQSLCEGMKEMFLNQALGKTPSGARSEVINGTLANKVRTLIKNALSDDIDEEINRIGELNTETWESCVDDVTKSLMNSPQMVCMQENINNVLETCTQELITDYPSHQWDELNLNMADSTKFNMEFKCKNDEGNIRSNNLTPILQPYQYIEIAHSILSQKPVYIRVQAFDVLLSSQLTDALSSAHWPALQKSLQSVLSDDNIPIFHSCIRVHAKLITSTSPEGAKESFLNVLESLCQHYYTQKLECAELNSQVPSHYRVIKLCGLMLDCIKEIINNLPRFGEKRLTEMIDNFVHLISAHSSSSSHVNDKTSGLTIFDVVSCLDPEANWFKYLSHNAVSRKIIFLKMSQNFCLLRIITEEVIEWFNNPLFADEDILSGHISKEACKFAKFIHCLSLISKLCMFDTGRNLFPITLNKNEEPIKIQKITGMVLKFLNKQQIIEEQLEIIFSDFFIKLMVDTVENLMHFKDISNYNMLNLLQILYEPLSEKPELPPQHTVSILTSLCDHPEGPQNYFFKYGLNNNKKRNIFFNIEASALLTEPNINSPTNYTTQENNHQNNKELRINNIERQIMTMKSTIDSFTLYSFCPTKILTNVVVTLLKTKKLRDMTVTAKLLNICCKLFQTHEGISILDSNKSQLIQNAAIIYQELINMTKQQGGYKILEERNVYLLFSSIENFIIMIGTTPLGFNLILEEQKMMSDCFVQRLQLPKILWQDPKWRLFVSFASNSKDGADVITMELKHIFKDVLLNLWSIVDDDIMTDSNIEIDEAVNFLIICVSTIGVSLGGVKAVFNDVDVSSNNESTEDGDIDDSDDVDGDIEDNDDTKSDETVTELTESYPDTITSLILKYGILNNTVNYKLHEIALSTLNVLISNMNNILYLQNKLKFQEKLLSLQTDNRMNDCNLPASTASSTTMPTTSSTASLSSSSTVTSSFIIIDECSLLRHEILEKIYSLGPCSNSNSNINKLEYKLYDTCPTLLTSQLKTKPRPRTHGELSKFLQETRNGLHDINWLKQARKAYRGGNNDEIKSTLLSDLVEQVRRALNNGVTNNDANTGIKWVTFEDVEDISLFPEDYIGIQMTVRYGVLHRLLQVQSISQSSDNLAQLLKLTRYSLFNNQNWPQQFNGFDWFLATIYLVCCGNVEKCQNLLSILTTFPSISFIWDQYSLSLGQPNLYFGHMLETVIKCELPLAFYALQEGGISWWLLCNQWIKECFWRVLDWNQVCHWLIFCILHQPDYIIYFCASILHHIEQRVLEDSNNGLLWKLMTCPPEKLSIPDHLFYMDKLSRRYHSTITPYLETFPP
ncbi:protein broad-minded-like [Lycorma delicatula]|uniref:protein broad-minded-like n=1 Tax=Lycorma delicatula TaxID=130591 RepID=UPI003F50F3ED